MSMLSPLIMLTAGSAPGLGEDGSGGQNAPMDGVTGAKTAVRLAALLRLSPGGRIGR